MYDGLHSICDKHGIFLRREAIALGYSDQDLARARTTERAPPRAARELCLPRPLGALVEQREARLARDGRASDRSHCAGLLAHHGGAPAPTRLTWELPLEDVHVTRLDRRSGRREAGDRPTPRPAAPVRCRGSRGARASPLPLARALDLTTMRRRRALPTGARPLPAHRPDNEVRAPSWRGRDVAVEWHAPHRPGHRAWPTLAANRSASHAARTCSGATGCRPQDELRGQRRRRTTDRASGLRLARARSVPRVRRQGEVPQVPPPRRERGGRRTPREEARGADLPRSPVGAASGSRGRTSTAPRRRSPTSRRSSPAARCTPETSRTGRRANSEPGRQSIARPPAVSPGARGNP